MEDLNWTEELKIGYAPSSDWLGKINSDPHLLLDNAEANYRDVMRLSHKHFAL